jgi:TolA-binding protein
MECPNKDCKARVDGHHATLYGPDGMGGVVGCMKKFVTKKAVWVAVCVFGLTLISTGVKVWTRQEVNPHIYTKKAESAVREMRVTRLEEQFKSICESQKRIEGAVQKIQSDQLQKVIEQNQRILEQLRQLNQMRNPPFLGQAYESALGSAHGVRQNEAGDLNRPESL